MVDPAGGEDLLLDGLRHVHGNGKRQALVAAGARVDLGVDADHFATHVDERSAGVARVDGGVGLDERHEAVAWQRAPHGAVTERGDRLASEVETLF